MKFKDYSSAVENATKNKKDEKKNSSSNTSGFKDYSAAVDRQILFKSINADTFESDLKNIGISIGNIYNGWQTKETMRNTLSSAQGMYDRLRKYQDYQKKYGGTDLSEFLNSYKKFIDDWDVLSELYGAYQNVDAFNMAKKNAELSKQFEGLSYDEVQEEKKKHKVGSDEYAFLDTYTEYTDLNDFNKALEIRGKSSKEKEEILKNVNSYKDKINGLKFQANSIKFNNSKAEFNPNFKSGKNSELFNLRDNNFKAVADYESELKVVENEYNNYLKNLGYENEDALLKSIEESNKYNKKLETAKNQYKLDHTFDLFKDIMQNKDFAENSKYVSTKGNYDNWWEKFNEGQYGLGYGDLTYEYINNVKGMRDEIERKNTIYSQDSPQVFDTGDSSMKDKGYDKLNPDEIAVYNYIYKTEGADKAQAFLDEMEITLSKRTYDEQTKRWENAVKNPFGAIVHSALSVPASVYGSIPTLVDGLKDAVQGKEYNPYSANKTLTNYASDIRGYVGENIADATEDFEFGGQNIPSFLYSTGMSIADTLLGAATLNKAYAPLISTNAFHQKAKEMTEAGEDKETIYKTALASGAAEYVFEKFSLDNFLKIKNVDGVGKIVTNVLKQAGIEGSEEIGTEIANILSDNIIRGEKSELSKKYQELLERGFSEKEANIEIAKQIGGQVAWSGIGGALSGGMMGISGSVGNYTDMSSIGKDIKDNERVSELFNIASNPEVASAYETYTNYAKKGITADNISNAQLGNLYDTAKTEAQNTFKSKKSTDEQKSSALKTLAELSVVETENVIKKGAKAFNVGEETKVTKSGETIDIKGIKIKGDEVTVATDKGEISADDITLTQNNAEILGIAKEISKTEGEDVANLFISQYDGKMDVGDYATSFNLTMEYAKNNYTYETILNRKGALSAETVNNIYKETRIKADNEQKERFQNLAKQMADKKFYKGFIDETAIDYNNTSAEGKVNWNDLTSRQKESVTFVKGIAQATGMNLVFVANNPTFNGKYDRTTNTLSINLDKGGFDAMTNIKETIIPTMSHETTHWMREKSPELWRSLNSIVFSTLAEHYNSNTEQSLKDKSELFDRLGVRYSEETLKTQTVTEEDLINNEYLRLVARYKKRGKAINEEALRDEARDEIISRACEDMLGMSEQGRKIFKSLSETEQKSLFDKMKAVINDLLTWADNLLNSYKATSTEARIMREYKDQLQKASEVWDKMLEESVEVNQALEKSGAYGHTNAELANVGLKLDAESGSVAPTVLLSEKTWTESEYVQDRETAINAIVKALGVTEKDASRYVDNINSIARMIADDRTRLDYEQNIDENASALKTNKEYKWTVDMSTLCAKRLLFTGTFDAIQKKLPNTVFNSEDIVSLRSMMMERGYEVACGICYVESTRRELGPITAEFIERYKLAQKNGTPISKINSAGKEVTLQEKGTKRNFYAEDGYIPTLAELNTTDIDLVKRDHPEVYAAYLSFMKSRGQAIPKLLETRTEYKGEILKHFNSKSAVKSRNDAGGLRVQSFSDFEVAHLIDMMQIVLDMSRVGLMSQAYTKVPAFADVFGNTGMKINLSLIAKGSGLDKNGNLIFDDVEGMPHQEAFRLRDKYSKNVGTILVGKNDAHIRAALADSRIDFIIPVHKSFWKESLYDALGLTGYDDYTDTQNEKPFDKDRKIKNFQPSEYWDYSKSGEENAKTYLKMCAEDGRIPKFPQFQNCEGYWKLLIDFKMYDNDGVGSPQMTVKPEFSMDEANTIMKSYEGGHRTFPVAQDVVDDFTKQYEGRNDILYSEKVTEITEEDYKNMKNHFGMTGNFEVAGYMLKDGRMLDFSGKHWGDATSTFRQVDHRDIQEALPDENNGRDSMVNMISNGNIRLMPEVGGINLAVAPSTNQRTVLRRYIEYMSPKEGIIVDIDEVGGDTLKSFTYNKGTSANTIMRDIDNYFKGGTQSELMRFHTAEGDGVLLSEKDSEGNTLTKGQQEYFKESKARDTEGRLLTLYHGTDVAGFTVFNPSNGRYGGNWFTTSRLDADSYAGNYKHKLFNPDEKADIHSSVGGNFTLNSEMRFDSAEDLAKFKKDNPGAENYLTDAEITEQLDKASENDDWDEYDRLENYQYSSERKSIERAYSNYEWEHSRYATIGELIENPDMFSLNDVLRAYDAFDTNNGASDAIADGATKEDLVESLRVIESEAEEGESILDINFKARLNPGESGTIENYANNRTYACYVNAVTPYEINANGKTLSMNGLYAKIEQGMKNSSYDSVIVRNARVGAHEEIGDVVIIKNSNQAKLTTNTNPTLDNDIMYSEKDYSYDSIISKPDMKLTVLDSNVPNNRADIIHIAKKNAIKVGKINAKDKTISVFVDDVGRDIVIGTKGLQHGLRRLKTLQTDANSFATLKAGEIIKNSIRINEITPKNENADSSYVLIGAAKSINGDLYVVQSVINQFSNELLTMDVLYSVNTKKENRMRSMRPEVLHSVTDSTISIAELLDYVNKYFPDILPESVLKHYAYDSRPEGELGEDALYSEKNKSTYDIMGETERIKKENEKFKAEVERLKERLKLERQVTHGNYFNENQLGAVAGHLRNISKSLYSKDKLVNSLRDVYSFIAHSENLTWEEVFERCYGIAEAMLEDVKPEIEVDDYYKQILKDIRGTRISLSDAQKKDAAYIFDKNWNRYFFGKVIITDNGTPIERQWQEWAEIYPELFNADISDGNMLSELYDTINSLKDASETIVEYDAEEQTRWLAREIYNQYWNVSPVRTTADKYDKQIRLLNFEHRRVMTEFREEYNSRIKEQRKADKERYKKLAKEIRERKDKEIAIAKQHGIEKLDKYKENAERKTRIQSITANALSLNEMLVKNSKDKHVPEIMREPVAMLLKAIDFSSKRLLDKGEPTQKDISLSKALGKVKDMMVKATNAHNELVELYGHGLDEDIEKMVDSVDNIMRNVGDNEFILNKMTPTDLKTLDKMVKTIRHAVNKLNKFHTINHARGIANLSQESVLYLDSLGKGKIFDGKRGAIKKLLNWGNALPYYVFKRYGNGGMKVYEALQDGWDKFAFNVKKIMDYANDSYTNKEVKAWSDEVKTFKILVPASELDLASENYVPQYQEVQLTVPQIMSMYCLNKREQARSHLFKGGIRVADFKTKKGNIVSQSEGIVFTESDVRTIFDSLTDRQKAVADRLQEFMNTVCADWGNDVSMARFGYKAFGEANYFPIQSDANNLAVNDETEQPNSLFKLLNMSFTKSTIENANNRIVISDIFDVFAQHTSDMAKYNALALPVLDSFKWYNYTEKQDIAEGTFKTRGVKQSIERAFGKDGQNYFTTFLKDINGQQAVSRDTIGNGFFKNAKIAAVGANLRVVLLQPTSYVRASAVIDNRYLVKALMHTPKTKRAETHCGIALWKSMGYYDTNIQKGVVAQIKHNDTLKDKAIELSMKGAEIADKVTWGYLWNACELEIRKKRKDLKVGSEEFYTEIGKRLREVIYATQVVDSTMTRSQMMRSSDGKDKMLTAFASEPTLSYNMLQDAYMGLQLDARRMGKKEAWKKNGKRMARIVTAYTMTNAIAALVEAGFDAFRDDEEEEMDMATFMEMYLSNFASDMSISGKVPYIKEIHSIIKGFGSSRSDTQWMEGIAKAIKGLYKLYEGKGNATTVIKNSIKAISDLSGLPFYNVYRDAMATLNKLELFTTEDLNEMFEGYFE